ncbi:MAG: hypothetical protein FWE79_01645, partial [Firmicutes bacterium]|nr:hypothetical protein [Bacillota bacterium]
MAKKKEIVGVAPESDPAKKEKKPRIPWTEEQKKALRTKILKLLLIVAIVGIFSGLMYWLFHSIGVVGGTAASREKALLDLVGECNEFVLYLVFA